MGAQIRQVLAETGFSPQLTERYLALEAAGKDAECLRMLRCQRCELVEALHEAQRPIDVIDWEIHQLSKRVG